MKLFQSPSDYDTLAITGESEESGHESWEEPNLKPKRICLHGLVHHGTQTCSVGMLFADTPRLVYVFFIQMTE